LGNEPLKGGGGKRGRKGKGRVTSTVSISSRRALSDGAPKENREKREGGGREDKKR